MTRLLDKSPRGVNGESGGVAFDAAAQARLASAVKAYGGPSKVSADLGISRQSLSNMLGAKAQSDVGAVRLLSICQRIGVSIEWVLTGEAPKIVTTNYDALLRLPVLSSNVSAGPGAVAPDAVEEVGLIELPPQLLEGVPQTDQMAAVQIRGESMEPELRDGDWLLFDRRRRELRDGLFVIRLDDALLVKRLQVQGRFVNLVSTNPNYPPVVLDRRDDGVDFEVIGAGVWTCGRV